MCIPKSAIRSFLAVAIAGMAFSVTVSAQQGEVPSAEGKSFSATNWYISASAGEQWLLNGYRDGRSFVGKINAGTWITPWHGVKMNAQWGSKKLAGLNSAMYFSAGIDYTRAKDLTSPTALDGLFGGSSRGRTGTFGINHEARVEYRLYVRKDELDWARQILRE